MFLKKELLHIPFLKRKCFNIDYDDIDDLKLGVVSLCELLKKDVFLIQIFSGDLLNEEFSGWSDNLCKYKNFNVYLIKNVEAVKRLNFENIRFLNIYGIDNSFITDDSKLTMREIVKYGKIRKAKYGVPGYEFRIKGYSVMGKSGNIHRGIWSLVYGKGFIWHFLLG